MSRQQLLQLVIAVILVLWLVVGCGAPAATPVSEAPAVTSTPVPQTATPVPPTVTPTPPLPTAQPTPAPQPTKPAPLTGNNLNTVWGSSGSDVFAAGGGGTILHYDGSAWSPMSSPTTDWLLIVWGDSGSNVFAAGDGGTLLHYNGSAWSPMNSGTDSDLWGVWGSSGSNVFAVGWGGTILHYDGSAWSPMDSGTYHDLRGVWGSSGSDVFAVGSVGTILHYNGSAWSPMNSGTDSELWHVWGSSGSDVFAVGWGGTILHYDGSAWSPMNSGTSKEIWGVWGSSGSDVFIVGEVGTILHYDGSAWSPMNSGKTAPEISSVWGSSGSDVFAVGWWGTILHYDGSVWSDMSSGAAPVSEAPAATATPVPPPATPAPTSAAQQARVTIEDFTLDSQALAGNLLGDPTERPVSVILPPGYAASDKRYPVVYYLNGYCCDASTEMLYWLQDWYMNQYSGTKNATGDLIHDPGQAMQRGEIQDLILVFPNGGNRFGGSMYLSSPTIGDYETYLTQELVDYVDSHYRTLPRRESRGLTGCSMGGDGAAHLGLKYPDVYAVVVPQSGGYYWDRDPCLLEGAKEFTREPADYHDYVTLPGWVQCEMAVAAAVAPSANKPPFYLDMPWVIVDGKTEIAPGFVEKVKALDPRSDVERYLAQPTRLNALLVQHGANDDILPVELARDFDTLLTEKGIAHEFDDSFFAHCSYDMIPPMLKFMSDHLVGEEAGE